MNAIQRSPYFAPTRPFGPGPNVQALIANEVQQEMACAMMSQRMQMMESMCRPQMPPQMMMMLAMLMMEMALESQEASGCQGYPMPGYQPQYTPYTYGPSPYDCGGTPYGGDCLAPYYPAPPYQYEDNTSQFSRSRNANQVSWGGQSQVVLNGNGYSRNTQVGGDFQFQRMGDGAGKLRQLEGREQRIEAGDGAIDTTQYTHEKNARQSTDIGNGTGTVILDGGQQQNVNAGDGPRTIKVKTGETDAAQTVNAGAGARVTVEGGKDQSVTVGPNGTVKEVGADQRNATQTADTTDGRANLQATNTQSFQHVDARGNAEVVENGGARATVNVLGGGMKKFDMTTSDAGHNVLCASGGEDPETSARYDMKGSPNGQSSSFILQSTVGDNRGTLTAGGGDNDYKLQLRGRTDDITIESGDKSAHVHLDVQPGSNHNLKINGQGDKVQLHINPAKDQNVTVTDTNGKVVYQSGNGGTAVTVPAGTSVFVGESANSESQVRSWYDPRGWFGA